MEGPRRPRPRVGGKGGSVRKDLFSIIIENYFFNCGLVKNLAGRVTPSDSSTMTHSYLLNAEQHAVVTSFSLNFYFYMNASQYNQMFFFVFFSCFFLNVIKCKTLPSKDILTYP